MRLKIENKIPVPPLNMKSGEVITYLSPGWFKYHGAKHANLMHNMPGASKLPGGWKIPASLIHNLPGIESITYAPKDDRPYLIGSGVKLFDRQIQARDKLEKLGRYGLAWEMGLGKTIGALCTIHAYERVIIVIPSKLLGRWQEDIEKVLPGIKGIGFTSQHYRIAEPEKGEIQIVTYSMLEKFMETGIAQDRYDFIIADEVHNVKNYKGAHSKAYHLLVKAQNRPKILGLTATPAPDDIEDWYGVLQTVNPWAFGVYEKYRDRYLMSKLEIYGDREVWKVTGMNPVHLPEFKARIADTFDRQTVKDHEDELPPLDIREVPIPNPHPHFLTPGPGVWVEYASKCLDCKIPVITQGVRDAVVNGEPVCVAVLLHDSYRKLMEVLEPEFGSLVVGITGEEVEKKRAKALASAKSRVKKGEPVILLVTAKAVLEGLELTEWQRIDLCQFSYYPMEVVQFLGRFRRVSRRDGAVRIRFLYEEGSFEESIILTVQQKLVGTDAVMESTSVEKVLTQSNLDADISGMFADDEEE